MVAGRKYRINKRKKTNVNIMLKESLFFFLHPQGGHWVSCRVGFLAGLFVMLVSIATVAGKTTSMDLA